jgi:hypothetical protein
MPPTTETAMNLHTRTITTAGTAALAATIGLAALAASPAGAAERTGQGIETAKSEAAAAIATRQTQLDTLGGRLGAAPGCDTEGHVAGVISADRTGLAALGEKIAADTDPTGLAADIRSIFQDFRVYAVVTAQANTAAACGHVTSAAATLTADLGKTQAVITTAKAAGKDTASAEAAAADMGDQLAAADGPARETAAAVASLDPDHGDQAVAAANATAVQQAHEQMVDAGRALRTAAADLRVILAEARSW